MTFPEHLLRIGRGEPIDTVGIAYDAASRLLAARHATPPAADTGAAGPLGIYIVGLTSGNPTPVAGQWLVEYDPTRSGVNPAGEPVPAHIVCSPDPAKAMRFADEVEAHRCWTTESGRPYPMDRPLTAFSILVLKVPNRRWRTWTGAEYDDLARVPCAAIANEYLVGPTGDPIEEDHPEITAEIIRRGRDVYQDHAYGYPPVLGCDHHDPQTPPGRDELIRMHQYDELVFGGYICVHCTPATEDADYNVGWPCPPLREAGVTDEEAEGLILARRAAIAAATAAARASQTQPESPDQESEKI